MTRQALIRIIVIAVIAIVLGGASLIVLNNSGTAAVDAASGFLH